MTMPMLSHSFVPPSIALSFLPKDLLISIRLVLGPMALSTGTTSIIGIVELATLVLLSDMQVMIM
jgi:hypothetical protein